jgi:hypothetical protein
VSMFGRPLQEKKSSTRSESGGAAASTPAGNLQQPRTTHMY